MCVTNVAPQRGRQSRQVERVLRKNFAQVDAYRYNLASIRGRVVDPRFEGKNRLERENLVLPAVATLPASTQNDIVFLLLLAPGERDRSPMNVDFEDPSRDLG